MIHYPCRVHTCDANASPGDPLCSKHGGEFEAYKASAAHAGDDRQLTVDQWASREARRPQPGRCKGCGRSILWITTRAGKPAPAETVFRTIISESGDYVKGHESHFAFCPQAKEFRNKGGLNG